MAATVYQPLSVWNDSFDEREEHAARAAHDIDAAVVQAVGAEMLIDTILNDHAAGVVAARYDEFEIETRDPAHHPEDPLPDGPQPLEFVFVLPMSGAARAVRSAGWRGEANGARYTLRLSLHLALDADMTGEEVTTALANERRRWFERVAAAVEDANARIGAHRDRIREVVEPIVRQRQRQLLLLKGAAAALNIPLDHTPSMGTTIPVTPRALTLDVVEASARAGGNEASLAADVARALIDQISSFGNALERSPVAANRLAGENEETLRDFLLIILNANWKGAVTGETFIGRGKTDLHLRWNDRDAFIGECKFWKGPKAFHAGLEQLLNRYVVWRATQVAMVLFIREQRDISAAIKSAEEVIERHERYIGCSDTATGQHKAFLMRAQHDGEQIVTLTLIPVVIPDQNDAS